MVTRTGSATTRKLVFSTLKRRAPRFCCIKLQGPLATTWILPKLQKNLKKFPTLWQTNCTALYTGWKISEAMEDSKRNQTSFCTVLLQRCAEDPGNFITIEQVKIWAPVILYQITEATQDKQSSFDMSFPLNTNNKSGKLFLRN